MTPTLFFTLIISYILVGIVISRVTYKIEKVSDPGLYIVVGVFWPIVALGVIGIVIGDKLYNALKRLL